MNPDNQFVECNGERYYIREDISLVLECEIRSLNEVKGLKDLVNLEFLAVTVSC
jgi:hypothetical protein